MVVALVQISIVTATIKCLRIGVACIVVEGVGWVAHGVPAAAPLVGGGGWGGGGGG